MIACPPFRLVPWDTDFLEQFETDLRNLTDGRPGKAVVIFMNDRPRRYLLEQLRTDPALPHPCLLPRILTLRECIAAWRQVLDPGIRREIGKLDQVALLAGCVREVANPESELCRRLAETDAGAFFPWGLLLADLLEECFIQGLTPEDLAYTEGEVAPFGAALLGSLRHIFVRYRQTLVERSYTTPGFDAFTVFDRLTQDASTTLPPFLANRPVFIAGHGILTGTEDTLLRVLWKQGAHIFLHGDPALAEKGSPHWACADQARWIANWGSSVLPVCPPRGKKPHFHYFAGYDLHSQLSALRDDLLHVQEEKKEQANRQDSAVVLTHADTLLPVLHHLPYKDCNISLGYPLERSLLCRLLDIVLAIRVQLRPNGTTHWRSLAELVRHPYIRLLEADGQPLREPLRIMERHLREGGRFVSPQKVGRAALEEMARDFRGTEAQRQALTRLLEQVLYVTIEQWANISSLKTLADALGALCETLLMGGEKEQETMKHAALWNRFPIDAECLFRLLQRVIPALKANDLADTSLPWPLLQSMLRELVREERVPFEADPLVGLQVLGMLETRLLRFSRVFLIDVTEDQLPGAPVRNPLLPDSLRALLGLPDTSHRERLAAYTFHRLLAGADEVWLYWQEGVEHSGLFEEKKQRSRFVEELIWEEEQARHSRLKSGQTPLRAASPDVRPPRRERRVIRKTAPIRARVATLLRSPLSSTRLDTYLTCPLRYYFQWVSALMPQNEVTEDDDPLAVGELLHQVLHDFYRPYVGSVLGISPETAPREQDLRQQFLKALDASGLCAALPPESAAMIRVAGPERLARFLHNQPVMTEILSVEESLTAEIKVGDQVRKITGRLDRVDWRGEGADAGAVILDYKTGRLKKHSPTLWGDDDFWALVAPKNVAGLNSLDSGADPLPVIADKMPSVQLLYYCYLYEQATGDPVRDAAFVELSQDGEEKPLFGDMFSFAEREFFLNERIPQLIDFIIQHMERCPEFRPREGKHCDWCSWKNACMISARA